MNTHVFFVTIAAIVVGSAYSTERGTCPDGQMTESCLVAPCDVTSCPSFPDAVCENDYCGGCYARFYVDEDLLLSEEQCSCVASQCTVAPCSTAACTNYPDATCVNNYCNGCQATFYSGGAEVTSSCNN